VVEQSKNITSTASQLAIAKMCWKNLMDSWDITSRESSRKEESLYWCKVVNALQETNDALTTVEGIVKGGYAMRMFQGYALNIGRIYTILVRGSSCPSGCKHFERVDGDGLASKV
jgi:hypothetical protein